MTLDEIIHVFENSKLVSDNFSEQAVTAAYVEALAALYELREKLDTALDRNIWIETDDESS